jgi:hypothetical protein
MMFATTILKKKTNPGTGPSDVDMMFATTILKELLIMWKASGKWPKSRKQVKVCMAPEWALRNNERIP